MNDTVASLLREYHRRLTHYKRVPSGDREPLADAQVSGELIGLRGALGIALDGQVRGGEADRIAMQETTAGSVAWKPTLLPAPAPSARKEFRHDRPRA
ncbi:hypothetical protein [Streptomyces halstedii]|uniref:hypothetical protein n=1 Tax=Streptomyces halstedii TaxID=1944 RepID=UPI00380CB652